MKLRTALLSTALTGLLACGSVFADSKTGHEVLIDRAAGATAEGPAGTPDTFVVQDIAGQVSPSLLCNSTGAGLPFITLELGSFATVTGLGWNVRLETNGASWANEARMSFGNTSTPIQINLNVGANVNAPTPPGGTQFASAGIVDFGDLSIPNIQLDADGLLRITFCETFNQNANPDAFYRTVSELTVACFDCSAGGTPGVGLSGTEINFGAVVLGTTSAAQGMTFTNTGDADGSFTWSAAAAPFAITGSTCGGQPATLAPGATCTLSYTYTPSLIVEQSQVITVSVADGDPPSASFTLRGTGVQPPGVAVPSLNVWGTALLLGALLLVGFFGLRRLGSL